METEDPDINYTAPHGNFSRWDIAESPMWLDFGDPTIDHIHQNYSAAYDSNPDKALIAEDYTEHDWVYLIITASNSTNPNMKHRKFVPVAHPIHLHGHDFALVAQESRPFHPLDLTNGTFHYNNPPRRDVALLPNPGYIAIAFQTDNPGIWLIHCHIAWHASSGLGLQIRERNHAINLDNVTVSNKDEVCRDWRAWYGEKKNWWSQVEFQDDSGV